MKACIWAVWGILDAFLEYRFLHKMLGAKYRFTFVWFYLGSVLYGNINKTFVIAGTIQSNFVYLCTCALVLNILLFHGSVVKKFFFTLWIYCASGIVFCAVFPLFHAWAVAEGPGYCPEAVLDRIGIAVRLVQYLMMEILQRKLYLLKRDFADQDAFYLMYIIVFIYAALSMMLNMFTGVTGWTGDVVYQIALYCTLISAAGVGLHVFCIVMLEHRLLKRLAEQQYQMLDQHLEISREQYDQLAKMRHDMRNHDLCLTQLLAEGKTKEALHYLAQMDERMGQGQAPVQTGSVYVDALLNPKYRQAQKLGIDISIRMSVPGEEEIAAVDLCCILANALDNALEACARAIQAGEPAGWIRMRSKMYSNYWVLEISNSIHIPVAAEQGTFPSSKRLYFTGKQASGIGLQNIRAAVERYEGVLEVKSGEEFSLNVMLPVSSTAKKNPSATSE